MLFACFANNSSTQDIFPVEVFAEEIHDDGSCELTPVMLNYGGYGSLHLIEV